MAVESSGSRSDIPLVRRSSANRNTEWCLIASSVVDIHHLPIENRILLSFLAVFQRWCRGEGDSAVLLLYRESGTEKLEVDRNDRTDERHVSPTSNPFTHLSVANRPCHRQYIFTLRRGRRKRSGDRPLARVNVLIRISRVPKTYH